VPLRLGAPPCEEGPVAGWVAVLWAVSTVVIAVAVLVFLVLLIGAMKRMQGVAERVEQLLTTFDQDARPALIAARRAVDDASRVTTLVRHEVEGVVGVSEDVRERVKRLADGVEERLIDFETLLDLLHDEVEDTVLDVAAALRTTRRSASVFRTMKRAFLKRAR